MLIKTRKNARNEVLHSLRLGVTRDSAIALFHRIRRLEMFKHIPIPTDGSKISEACRALRHSADQGARCPSDGTLRDAGRLRHDL